MTAPFVNVSPDTQARVFGGLSDQVFTGAPPIPAKSAEGRTEALETLFDYLCEITFYRSAGRGKPPIPFQLNRAECYTEWPENMVDLTFPSIGVVPSEPELRPIGLAPVIDETTKDQFGIGTVVWRLWDYKEVLQLEVWASSPPERRALVEGLQQAFSPSENVSNLRLMLPTYFNQRASYTLTATTRVDDSAVKNRRLARLRVELSYEIVRHARYAALVPAMFVGVTDGAAGV